jgi:hypothetical protein
MKQVEAEPRTFDLDAARAAQVCSRARWVEEGESSTSYFFRLEKSRGCRQRISAVRKPDGQVARDMLDILATWLDFYKNIFTASPVDLQVQDSMLSNLEWHLSNA